MHRCMKYAVLVVFSAGCLFTMSTPTWAQNSEEQLLRILQSDAPAGEKAWACRELKKAGTKRAVPALAALLTDKLLSHSARYALETMLCPEAGAALREALVKAGGGPKSGIIDTLGNRCDRQAVPLLIPLLKDGNEQVAAAAATALGKIGTPAAGKALSAVLGGVKGEARRHVGNAYILYADGLAKAGQVEDALAIYRQLHQPGECRPIRQAALRGLLTCTRNNVDDMLLRFLAGDDADSRAVAAGHIRHLSDDEVKSLTVGLSKLPPAGQICVLAALAGRRDKSFLSVAVDSAKSENKQVRIVALQTLGRLGDASVVAMLIKAAFDVDGIGDVARRSLEIVHGKGTDEKITAAMQGEKDVRRRVVLIGVLDARKAVSAVPALLADALHEDAAVRSRAMSALSRLADPKHISDMVRGMLKAEKGRERDAAEKAVMFVCQQIPQPEKRADPVLSVVERGGDAQKAALLPMLGRIGGPRVLAMIRAALAGKNSDLYQAAVRAISNWPDAGVADQLLDLSQNARQRSHRIWALRALIRVIALPGKTSDEQKLAMLKRAMRLADRDEERKLVIERAAAVRSIESMRFVVPYLDRPPLAQQACRTLVELAHHRDLREPNKHEFKAALKKVLDTCKDRDTADRANRYLQGL